jgi:spermidine/putrescine transport system substrate-binding protein
MDKNELIDKIAEGKMTRREVTKALAAVGIVSATFPFLPTRGQAAAEDHPTMFAWSGYEEEGFHPAYIAKYGESPNFSFFGDEEEAFAKMRAGFKPDLSMPCSYKIPQWTDAGMLAEIDVSRLSNWKDTIPSLKEVPGTIIGGKRMWICQDWGQTSVLYRTDLVDWQGGEESWGILWDERYAGRMSMIDSLIDGVMVAAIYGGAKDPYNMTPDEVAMTKKLLQEQLPLLRFYSNSMTDVEQALASGELVAAVTWNSSFLELTNQGLPVAFANPKEGAMTWTCGLALMSFADPKKIDRAYDVLDAYISAEAGKYEIEEWGYGHANARAFDMVSAEDLKSRGLSRNPDDLINSGIFQEPIGNEPELQTMFEEVKAGL